MLVATVVASRRQQAAGISSALDFDLTASTSSSSSVALSASSIAATLTANIFVALIVVVVVVTRRRLPHVCSSVTHSHTITGTRPQILLSSAHLHLHLQLQLASVLHLRPPLYPLGLVYLECLLKNALFHNDLYHLAFLVFSIHIVSCM